MEHFTADSLGPLHEHEHAAETKDLLKHRPSEMAFIEAADTFGQLCDSTRLKILWLLAHSEECVSNIAVFIDGYICHVLRFVPLVLQRVFIGRRQLFYNILDDIRRAEDIADILEEEVAHETTANDLLTFQSARDRQYLCRVELNHFALFIFTENREEV